MAEVNKKLPNDKAIEKPNGSDQAQLKAPVARLVAARLMAARFGSSLICPVLYRTCPYFLTRWSLSVLNSLDQSDLVQRECDDHLATAPAFESHP